MPENRGLITVMIIIGILIVILLIVPRTTMHNTAYRDTAVSNSDFVVDSRTITTYHTIPRDDYYTIHRTIPRRMTTHSYPADTTDTTYSYTNTEPSYDDATQQPYYQNQGSYFPNGCTNYSAYSVTTGFPCR